MNTFSNECEDSEPTAIGGDNGAANASASTDPTLDTKEPVATIDTVPRNPTLFNLRGYTDDDFLTKRELCAIFKCAPRTMQRMVERFEIPPPIWLAGRKTWIVGQIRAWIADAANKNVREAAEVARKMHVFD